MLEGTVTLVPQTCNICGNPSNRPRVSTYTDRLTEEVITEAEWVCSRCGNRFSSGIVERHPKDR